MVVRLQGEVGSNLQGEEGLRREAAGCPQEVGILAGAVLLGEGLVGIVGAAQELGTLAEAVVDPGHQFGPGGPASCP